MKFIFPKQNVVTRLLQISCAVLLFFSLLSCKEKSSSLHQNSGLTSKIDSTISVSTEIQSILKKKIDSLKPVNEFEALKLENNLNLLTLNLDDLVAYRDSLRMVAKQNLPADNLLVLAATQADYVLGLVSSAKAMLENRSFSFGEWKDGKPRPISDTITTPIQKK